MTFTPRLPKTLTASHFIMASKRIGELLNLKDNGELGRTLKRSAAIGRLTQSLCDALPAEFATSLLSASIDADGTLDIRASSSAWAARLRFEETTLLDAARRADQSEIEVNSVRVRVGKPA